MTSKYTLRTLDLNQYSNDLYDNLGVVLMATNPIMHSRSKHFKIDPHRDSV